MFLVPARHNDDFLAAYDNYDRFDESNKIRALKTVSSGGKVPSDRHDLLTLRRITADHQHEGCGERRIHLRVAVPVVWGRDRFGHRREPERPCRTDVEPGSSSGVRAGGNRAVQIQESSVLIRSESECIAYGIADD